MRRYLPLVLAYVADALALVVLALLLLDPTRPLAPVLALLAVSVALGVLARWWRGKWWWG